MQTGNGQENKVISLATRGQKTSLPEASTTEAKDFSWEEIQRRNEENRQRMQKEREKANKGVIRSYRLKH